MSIVRNPMEHISFEPGTVLKSRFEILRPVQKGGMSAVYLAREGTKEYILKIERAPAEKTRGELPLLKREFSILSNLSYPHLPRVFEYFEDGPLQFLVEEYVEGATLKERMIKPEFRENISDICKIIFQVIGTLHFLNRKKIIYRDLKPAHIIIGKNNFVKLVDFGAARMHKKKKTADTIPLGTPGFASPEHFGYCQTNERSEVFTVGALLYNLLTGLNPADSPFLFKDPRTVNPLISEEISTIISKATRMRPEERFRNVRALLACLQKEAGALLKRKRLLFCPLCQEELETLYIGDVEIDGCPHCAGIWCDAKELEKIEKIKSDTLSEDMNRYWQAQLCESCAPSSSERVLCCPVCGLLMSTGRHRGRSGALLDRCTGGCGKWLDGGEIRLIRGNRSRSTIEALISMLRPGKS